MHIHGYLRSSNVIVNQRLALDLDRGMYRVEKKLFGLIPLGSKWQPLPPLDYVLMFKTFYEKCTACDVLNRDPGTMQVSLVYRKNRKLIIHETPDEQEARDMAAFLASQLDLRLRDAISDRRMPRWISVQPIANLA